MPRSPDLAISVLINRQTDRQTDKPIALPLVHAHKELFLGVLRSFRQQFLGKAVLEQMH